MQLNTACQKSSFCFIQGNLIQETSLKRLLNKDSVNSLQRFLCLIDTKWLQLPIFKTFKLKWNVYPKRKIPLLFTCMTFLLWNTKDDILKKNVWIFFSFMQWESMGSNLVLEPTDFNWVDENKYLLCYTKSYRFGMRRGWVNDEFSLLGDLCTFLFLTQSNRISEDFEYKAWVELLLLCFW